MPALGMRWLPLRVPVAPSWYSAWLLTASLPPLSLYCLPALALAACPCRAAAEDKVSGKRITAATCTSAKVMGFLAQLLMTPYGPAGKVSRGCAGRA